MKPTSRNLTDAQVKLGLSFIDRCEFEPHHRLLLPSQRYDRMIDLVRSCLADGLLAGDYGVADLDAVQTYFTAKRDYFVARGQ